MNILPILICFFIIPYTIYKYKTTPDYGEKKIMLYSTLFSVLGIISASSLLGPFSDSNRNLFVIIFFSIAGIPTIICLLLRK